VHRDCMQLNNVGRGPQQINADGPKRWLMRLAILLLKGLLMAFDCEYNAGNERSAPFRQDPTDGW
jgi:hypothetical protein